MESHDWIVSVIADLENCVAMHGLNALQDEISRTNEIAIRETGVAFQSEKLRQRLPDSSDCYTK